MAYDNPPSNPGVSLEVVIKIVDLLSAGSEYAVEAWKLFKKAALEGRRLTGEEIDELDELIDRAEDDLEGPGLRVDFSKDRIY